MIQEINTKRLLKHQPHLLRIPLKLKKLFVFYMYLHNHTHNYYTRHQTSSKAYVYISLFYLTLQPSNAIMWYFWKLVHKYTGSHLEQEVKIQQKKLFVVSRVLVVTKVLIIVVNDIDAKEYSGHSRVLVVTGTQCKVCIKFFIYCDVLSADLFNSYGKPFRAT